MKKNAFTLSEVLITLTILGVVAAVLIPTIMNIGPNKNKAMFKKAYNTLEKVVSELINDEGLYPEDTTLVGFFNTTAATIEGSSYSGGIKFCNLISKKLNIIGASTNCNAAQTLTSGDTNKGTGSFTTNDGITWYFSPTAFSSTATTTAVVTVDINGTSQYSNSSPNCRYNATTCKNPDQFEVYVVNTGRMYVTGIKEQEYIQSGSIK